MAQEDAPIGDGVTIVPSIRTKGNERQRTISSFYKPVGEEEKAAMAAKQESKMAQQVLHLGQLGGWHQRLPWQSIRGAREGLLR